MIIKDLISTAFKGTYIWSNVTNSWTKEANTAKIVLIFPATAISTTNNARAEINNYQDELVMNQDNENVYLPKKAHLFISVDNTKQLEVTLRNVEYKKLGEGFTRITPVRTTGILGSCMVSRK